MAHTKSAKKRIKTNEKKRVAHKARGTAAKTWTKKVLKAVVEGNKAQAREELVLAYQRIDKVVKDRVLSTPTPPPGRSPCSPARSRPCPELSMLAAGSVEPRRIPVRSP